MQSRLKFGFAILFAFFAVPARAQDVDIPYQAFTLENGLRVVVHEDRKAPIIAVSVWYHVGSKDEPQGKTGFAHLFEHLMFNGSENHDTEYFEPLQQVGGTSLNGTTWTDRTNYYQDVPTPALELALFLESDRMGHLLGAITQEKLDNQRGVVQNEKRQRDNQPYGASSYRFLEGLYPQGHPYRWPTIGSMEDLDNASLEDVKDWFRQYYGPNNAVVVLAGDIDAKTAKPLMEAYFGDIPPGPPLPKLQSWVPELESNIIDTMVDRVPQVRIQRAWSVPGLTQEAASQLAVVAGILGDGKNSRLYKKLVFEEQVATSVYVSVTPWELTSPFEIEIDVKDGADPKRVEDMLNEVLADFLEKGPTKTELMRAKTKLKASQIRGLEKVGGGYGKASTLARGALYAGDPAFYKTKAKWVEEATPKSLRAVANEWLSKGYYQLTILPFDEGKAVGDGIDRAALPKVAASPDIDFPDFERATLSNGMEVIFAQRTAVPVVEMALQFDAGYASDKGGKLGLSDVAMAMLDEGTGKRGALEIASQKELLGAQIEAQSSLDVSTVTLSALKANLAPSLALFADIVRNPSFPEEDFERLRGQALAGIDSEQADPFATALRLLPPLLYGEDHPYGVPFTGSGTAQDVAAITRADLTGFHEAWIRPDNAAIFVVGDTSLEKITPMLEKAFGDWRAPKAAKGQKTIAEAAQGAGGEIIIVDRPGSPQSLILGGILAPPTGAGNNIAINAMNDVIGGSFTSRINTNLREDKGWAYVAQTFMRSAKGQRPYMVYAPVQADKTAASVAEIMRELREYVADRPATADELSQTVNNSSRALPGQFETADAVLGSMMRNRTYGRPDGFVESLPGQFRALTLDDVMAAAKEVIVPQRFTWLVIGDASQIKASLEDLGIGPVSVRAAAETSKSGQ